MTTSRRPRRDAAFRAEQPCEANAAARCATLNLDTASFPNGLAFVDDLSANCMSSLPDDQDDLFCTP